MRQSYTLATILWMGKMMAALAVLGVVLAAPAHADDALFLSVMHQQYFARSFTDQQLLQEGYRVCQHSSGNDIITLANMVSSDLGVSNSAGGSLVGAAEVGLGC